MSGGIERARSFQRLACALLGAAVAGALGAVLETGWARAAAAEPPSFGATVLAVAGLNWPLVLVVGLAVAGARLILVPEPAPWSRVAVEGAPQGSRRGELALLLPFAALATALLLVVQVKLALQFFVSSLPAPAIGFGLAVTAVVAAGCMALISAGLARIGRHWRRAPPPIVSGAIGLALAALFIAFAIASGDTSGVGGFLAEFGVFKRPELDLRPVAHVLIIALGAFAGSGLGRRVPLALALAVALAPLALTVRAAGAALDERRVAVTIERGAPLGKVGLALGRKLTDRDRDGFSSRFGGGDCDDASAAINPAAEDVPGNGRDEDCSGKDDAAVSLKANQPSQPAAKPSARTLPDDLSVVLITIDTLRYDLGYAGNSRPLSPNLDRLAQRSVVYENAYSLASYTSKSLAPFMIGKYPSETHRGWAHFNRFGKEDTFLQERLQRAGVRTLSVQGYWYFFQAGYGFERGFDVIDSTAAPKVAQVEGDKSSNSDKISDAALALLQDPANTRGKFFAWVHYIDPHSEYVKHEEFDFGNGSRDRYDSEVAFVDKHVGRILDYVQGSELAKRTAIVVTSDHGEAFGEHGMIRHGFELWEELVRVPLIVSVPGAEPKRIRERRSGIDVVPTVLELYGLPRPASEPSDFVSGQSLVPELFAPASEASSRIVFVDMPAGPYNADRQAFIENDMKLITSDGRPLGLYNLATDPAEKKDLLDDAAQSAEVIERYKAFRRDLKRVNVKPIPK